RARHRLRHVVPVRILGGAEVGAVEDLLEAQDLDALLPGLLDEGDVARDRVLLDPLDGERRVRDRGRALDQAADDLTRHWTSEDGRRQAAGGRRRKNA